MQKKIIALAIAAMVSAPAFADNANVTVYGKFIADVESVTSDKVATPATQATSLVRVVSNASRLGFKGEEDLGDGLKAIYQIETQVNVTGDATTSGTSATGGATSTNVGVFNGMRNTNVGLKGDFGTVFLGNWDTPYKAMHNKMELFDNTTIFSATNLIGRPSGKNFVLRQSNSIQYWSPNISGFDVKVAYAPDNSRTATTNKSLTSLSAGYENDMIHIALGNETHNDQNGSGLSNSATRLCAAYKLGTSGMVGVAYESATIKLATAATSGTVTGTELMASYKIGTNSLGASYVVMGDNSATTGGANTGANQLLLRYGYTFSKRTELFAAYTALANKSSGTYGFSSGTAFSGATAGSKLTGLGLGVVHSF